ncbi:GH25 family lysozyme [Enterococcus sp. CSURQ0835]|uniref:GH25 family lysozyme n=1 Tax=Enterococcus sp. CSURQ0835 TaxID=2681394 RepID=UPI00190F0AE0|nr:GH25 family lysozyme [Enterococcus sp. CSURQ0835]
MVMNGIDVASYQRGINMAAVPGEFVLIKATGGMGYVNPACDEQFQSAVNAGKLVGIYHYAHEIGFQGTAEQEARFFLDNIRGYIGKAVLVLDWESDNKNDVAWAKRWLDIVASEAGVKPLFYTYTGVLNSFNFSSIANADYGLWIAAYGADNAINGYLQPSPPAVPYWSNIAMFQYSSNTYLSGWGARLDANVFYGDADTWNAYAGGKPVKTVDGHLDTANINTGAFHVTGWMSEKDKDLSKTTPWLFFLNGGKELARVKGKWINRPDVGNAGVDFGGSTPQALQDQNFTVMFRASDNKGDEIQAELKFSNEFNLPKVSDGYLDKTKPNKDRELTLTGWHLDTRQTAGDAHWLYLMDADTNKPLKKWDVSKDSFQPSEDVAKHYSSQVAQATTCRFSTTVKVPDGLDGVKSYIISRYTNDKDGNGDGTKDYKFTDSLIFL